MFKKILKQIGFGLIGAVYATACIACGIVGAWIDAKINQSDPEYTGHRGIIVSLVMSILLFCLAFFVFELLRKKKKSKA